MKVLEEKGVDHQGHYNSSCGTNDRLLPNIMAVHLMVVNTFQPAGDAKGQGITIRVHPLGTMNVHPTAVEIFGAPTLSV